MTILEAIKESVGYPVSDKRAEMALLKRGLTKTEDATEAVLNSKNFELATADLIVWIVTTANVSEGGVSISKGDTSELRNIASGIYQKWGVKDSTKQQPTARFTSYS